MVISKDTTAVDNFVPSCPRDDLRRDHRSLRPQSSGYYAEIVREKYAGTKITMLPPLETIYLIVKKYSSEDYAPLSELTEGALDEIEAISNRDGDVPARIAYA